MAEAAKVLENTQRDVNIALMNEMSKICDLIGIRTADVLNAAGTKWNFLGFTRPGGRPLHRRRSLPDPKAQELGYHPEVILSGRRINDGMASHVAARVVQTLARNGRLNASTRVGILGMTFKENVPDIRNSRWSTCIARWATTASRPWRATRWSTRSRCSTSTASASCRAISSATWTC